MTAVASSSPLVAIEALESRVFLDATVIGAPLVVNVSRLPGPQSEDAIAVNPTNSSQVVLEANDPAVPKGMLVATSSDGGRTWARRVFGDGGDGLPPAFSDPTLSWDQYGNLFMGYVRADNGHTEVLLSVDAGAGFRALTDLPGSVDQPTIVTGHATVWVAFQQQQQAGARSSLARAGAVAYGAQVESLGRVGPFKRAEAITPISSNVGDIAVGPAGQVTVAYQHASDTGPSTIYTRTDPDGLGPRPFGAINSQISTNVGLSYPIPGQSIRTIDSEVGLAYDVSGDPYTGRLYMVYTDAPAPGSAAIGIYFRWSDDDGRNWSAPIKVNDDNTSNSHWFPKMAVDPATGAIGIAWYDSRNDTGVPGAGGTNGVPNDDVQVYGVVGTPTADGVKFCPNFVIQPAFSNANDIRTVSGAADPNQFGDYNGMAFYNGRMYPAWADNSDSTADNPDGALAQPDTYAAIVSVQVTPTPARTLIGEFGDVGGSLTFTAPNGARVTLRLHRGRGFAYLNGRNIDLRLVGTDDRSALRLTTHGGVGRLTLANVSIAGSLGLFAAPTAGLAGTWSSPAPPRHVVLAK